MGTSRARPIAGDENGAGILQVVMYGSLVAVLGYVFMQFMTGSDWKSMNMIKRNENLNFSTAISDFVNDRDQVRDAANVVDRIGAGAPIQYE